MTDPHRNAAITYVDVLMRETGLDLTNLARRAGVSSTTLTRFHNSPDYRNSLSGRTLKKLSDTTGIPLPADLGGAGAEIASIGTRTAPRMVAADIPRDLPVLGSARGPHTAYSFTEKRAQSYVERPWFLFGQPDAYAVYVNDTSMEPVLRPGQIVYVSPTIPAAPADDVVVQLTDGSGLIKRLQERGAKQVTLEQFSPVRLIELGVKKIRAMHLVVAVLRSRA